MILDIIQLKTSVAEASRAYDPLPSEIEEWVESGKEGMENASRVIGDWIGFYNHRRPHQALKIRTHAEAYALAV